MGQLHARLFALLGQALQVPELLAQALAQRQHLAFGQGDKAARAAAHQAQQLLQAEHAALVELELALQRQPVAPAAHLDGELAAVHALQAHRAPLGPVDGQHARRLGQQVQHTQGFFGLVEQDHLVRAELGIEHGQLGQHLGQPAPLLAELAFAPQAVTLVHTHQAVAAQARHHDRAKVAKGLHHKAQGQALARRGQLRAQPALWAHLAAGQGVTLQLKVLGQRLQRGVELGLRVGGHAPARLNEVGHLLLRRADLNQPRHPWGDAQYAPTLAVGLGLLALAAPHLQLQLLGQLGQG